MAWTALKIAFRRMRRQPFISTVNVVGLALGSAAVLLIALFVHHETSYDDFHADGDRVYQVISELRFSDGELNRNAYVPVPMPAAVNDLDARLSSTVALARRTAVVSQEDLTTTTQVLYAGPDFFDVFTFPLQHGSPAEALTRPDGVVLSEEWARRLFGRTDVVGETVSIRVNKTFSTFTVTGVTEPVPSRTSIPVTIVLPVDLLYSGDRAFESGSWQTLSPLLYVKLAPETSPEAVREELSGLMKANHPDAGNRAVSLLPLAETHLTPDIYGQLVPASDPLYSYLLAGLALVILAIALVNFTTLSLAQSADRGREVGMRKTLGAVRRHLGVQLSAEAFLTTGLALAVGLGLAHGLLPGFETFVDRTLDASVLHSGVALMGLLALWGIVGLLAGSYPAVVLSSLRPIQAIRDYGSVRRQPRLVAVLILGQFVLAVALVAGTWIMNDQFSLLQQKSLGYDAAQVIEVRTNLLDGREADRLLEQMQQQTRRSSALLSAAGAWSELGTYEALPNLFAARSGDDETKTQAYRVTPGITEALGINVVQGRALDADRAGGDTQSALVNRSFVAAMGWDDPIGRRVRVQFIPSEVTIVGVVEDIHTRSLNHAIEPLVMHAQPIAPVRNLFVRIAPGRTSEARDEVRDVWTQVAGDLPIEATFLDDTIQQAYASERRWGRIVSTAAGGALFIAVLGLFGLALLAAKQRKREVSIRRVLGASVASIVMLLSRRLLTIVGIAILLAVPIAYLGAQEWLRDFAYRVDVGWMPFVGAALVVMLCAGLPVAVQSWRMTRMDPAKALRDE